MTEDINRGKCPHCGSENIDYKAVSLEDELVIFPKECEDCKKNSEEVYRTIYIRTDKK